MAKKNITEISNSLELKLENIVTSDFNRKILDETKLVELAENIKKVGVIQSIVVRLRTDGKYEIVCGERRYRASIMAQKTTIPVVIRELTDEQAQELAFIENIHREDVSIIELAELIKSFIDARKEDFASMAARLGKSVKYIRDRYQLNNLTNDIKSLVICNTLSIGKAILLAAYSQETQEKVYSEYLNEKNYNNWLDLSYSKFVNKLDAVLNTNLDSAEFDKEDCKMCSNNSSITDMFASEGNCNARCLNKECFNKKSKDYSITLAIQKIEENPSYLIVKSSSCSEWIVTALEEQGIEVCSVKYSQYPKEPSIPIPLNNDDFIDEDTQEVDEETWEEAQKDYLDELEEYEKNLLAYSNKLQEIEDNLKLQKIENCFVIFGSKICNGYINNTSESLQEDDKEVTTDDTQDEPLKAKRTELLKLQEKDNRNREIKIEHKIEDIKKEILKSDIDLSETEGTEIEQNILFYFLLSTLSSKNRMKYFNKEYPSDKEKFEFVTKMTKQQQIVVIRDYIVSNLKSYACDANSITSQLLIEFCELHFEEQTAGIESKHHAIYAKRKKSIDERIAIVKYSIEANTKKEDKQEAEDSSVIA